jgi:uncharacterized protein (DUF58 family)
MADERPHILLPQGPITRFLRHVFNERLTDSGRLMFWVGIFTMAAGGVTLQIQVYLIYSVVVAVFLMSMVLSRLARARLRVDATLPPHTTCGARLVFPIRIENTGRRGAVDLVFREWRLPRAIQQYPPAGVGLDWLPGGATITLERELEFTRRGHYELPALRQETLFPWGLWRDIVDHRAVRTLLVYPRFHPLISLDIPVGRRYQPGGIALSSNLGDSIEFIGTREFREGDSLRAIHWKTWARLGRPAVKEFQEEYFCRVALLMDTFLPEPPRRSLLPRRGPDPGRRTFEAAISTAAAIADALSREEYIIDIFAAGPEIYYLQSGRSLAYLENVLDILACLEPCHEPPFEKIAPVLLEHLGSITTTIVLLLDWDEARAAMVRTIRDHGSAVKLIIMRDGPTTSDIGSAEALCGEVRVLTPQEEENGVESL